MLREMVPGPRCLAVTLSKDALVREALVLMTVELKMSLISGTKIKMVSFKERSSSDST